MGYGWDGSGYSYGYGYGFGDYAYGGGEGGEGGDGGSTVTSTIVYDGCANDDTLTDSYDDTCSEWYDENPGTCGDYDSDTFIATDNCCACMGYGWDGSGYSYGYGYGFGDYAYGGGEGGEGGDGGSTVTSTIVYDGCANDDTLTDSYDDTCSDWYDANPGTCGQYDTDTFISTDNCCACMGYGWDGSGYSYGYGYGFGDYAYGGGEGGEGGDGGSTVTSTIVYDGCANDDTLTDSYDDTCSEWYDANPDTCGQYDSDTFIATDNCCACMGYGWDGSGYSYGYGYGFGNGGSGGEGEGDSTTTTTIVYDGCANDDSLTDSYDDTCSEWYDSNPGTCGQYDTDTFISTDNCCACMGYGWDGSGYSYGYGYGFGDYAYGGGEGGEGGDGGSTVTSTIVYDGCANDDSLTDSYDDTCSEWYDANPDTCGDYDTDTFQATASCCACMGWGWDGSGYSYGYGYGFGYGGGEGEGEGGEPVEPAPEVVYDGCTNDDSVGDSYDDTCTEWYDANPGSCGDYDTETFVAADLCCACVGTEEEIVEPEVVEPEVVEPEVEEPEPVVYDGCTNDDSVGDSYDDTCTEWYDTNPDTCGDYDTETFVAADLCCACVGTEEEVVEPVPEVEEPEPVVYDGCTNDDSVGDSYDDTCTEWYDTNPNTCGDYDTETFVAADLCCACVGTEEEPETEPTATTPEPEAPVPTAGETTQIEDDESCCDCECEGGGGPPPPPRCEDYQHLSADNSTCTACQPAERQILTIEGNCADCPAYSYLDGYIEGGNFFTKCTPSECNLDTDIRYINGTCETCPDLTVVNDDNTGCIPVICESDHENMEREIFNAAGDGCEICDDYTHPDSTGYLCITDECDSITEYLNVNGSCKSCDAF